MDVVLITPRPPQFSDRTASGSILTMALLILWRFIAPPACIPRTAMWSRAPDPFNLTKHLVLSMCMLNYEVPPYVYWGWMKRYINRKAKSTYWDTGRQILNIRGEHWMKKRDFRYWNVEYFFCRNTPDLGLHTKWLLYDITYVVRPM